MAITARARNVASFLERTACCWPQLPAITFGSTVVHDYAGLASTVARLANGLRGAGVAPGDRVALVARNLPEYLPAMFAAWWCGAVAVPINAKLHVRELAFVLGDSAARVVFTDAEWGARVGSVLAELPACERVVVFGDARHRALLEGPPLDGPAAVADDDAAWLFYTSGTTGRPKGVVITHANLRAMTQCYTSDVECIAPGDALLHAAPLSHGSGLYAVPHVLGGAVNVIPESGGFDVDELASLLRRWPRASFFAAPTMVKRLVASGVVQARELAHLKCIVYGGGPMYVEDCRAACDALGPRLAQIYGQGESPMTITAMSRALLADAYARDDGARLASVGIAQTGMEVRIAGPDDASLATGETGEVLVRGPAVMHGYWRNEGASASTLAGGWLHTGDLGVLDASGFLTLKDRSKDLIISGGANIYPREVEEVLLGEPAVVEAAVVGRAHPDWGEEVVAFIVARQDADRAALVQSLDRRCLDHIARFKRPRQYRWVDELPRNNTGKVLKTRLRELLQDEEAGASAPPGGRPG